MNAIITGAGKGIGKAVALKFAEAGYDLLLISRTEETLRNTSLELAAMFPEITVRFMAADLSIKQQCIGAADWCIGFGNAEILVNNAGVYLPGNCIGEEDTLEEMLKTNLFSAYYFTRMIAPKMIEAKSGHIFNICSIASLDAYDGGGNYSISKYALHGFSKNLRHELKNHNVKVTSVFPGAVYTDSWKGFDNTNNRIMVPEDIAEMIISCSRLSPQAVVEDLIIRPQLGDL
jgi:short-subunit dehydrogenase